MKRLLIALTICFVFSSVAQAGKPGIGFWDNPGLDRTDPAPLPGGGNSPCTYTGKEAYEVFVRARKNTVLSMQLITDTGATGLFFRPIGSITSVGTSYRPDFEVPYGASWSLAWVLSSTKGKGKILDAVEVTNGKCQ